MTVRTFWTIILKLAGLWLAIKGLDFFFSIYLSGYLLTLEQTMLFSMIRLIFALALYVALPIGLIFQSQWFIDALRLDKESAGESIDLGANRPGILNIAVIVIGGLMLINALPKIGVLLYGMYNRPSDIFADFTGESLVFEVCKSVIGYLLITNAKPVVEFIEKRSKSDTIKHNDEIL